MAALKAVGPDMLDGSREAGTRNGHSDASSYAGFRVAILGSCQVGGIASTLEQLLPGASIKYWHYGITPGTGAEIADAIQGYDLVISQMPADTVDVALHPDSLREKCRRLVLLPIFGFPGLHPDCVLVYNQSGVNVETPLGAYNSAIVFASYKLGLSENRTKALFNSYIYNELGYFSAYGLSKSAIVTAFSQAGYEISNYIDSWLEEQGCFMYTTNHPRGEVMRDMAVLALDKVGVPSAGSITANQYLSLNAIWPVYPEIARRLGLEGSLNFVMAGLDGPDSASRNIDLTEYIQRSFQAYAQYDVASLQVTNPNAEGIIASVISR